MSLLLKDKESLVHFLNEYERMFEMRYEEMVALRAAKIQTADWIVAYVKG